MRKNYEAAVGAPTWIELVSRDVAITQDFYCGVFGWNLEQRGDGEPASFSNQNGQVAGLREARSDAQPRGWLVYLAVPNPGPLIPRVEESGGSVLWALGTPHTPGMSVLIRDPAQAAVGIAVPETLPSIERVAEPGAACWFELRTDHFEEAADFYADVLEWPLRLRSTDPPHRHASHGRGHSQRTSITEHAGDMVAGSRNGWMVHFGTDDCASTLQRIEQLGGTILAPVEEAGGGRMGWAADPDGRAFRLVEVDVWPADDLAISKPTG